MSLVLTSRRVLLLLLCLLLNAASGAFAATLSPQQKALYFAGLDGTAVDGAQMALQKKALTAWSIYEKRIGQPLLTWAQKEVAWSEAGTVFYPFSGPDFVTVERMFPNASRYVLVAIQKARPPADPPRLSDAYLTKLGTAWMQFGQLGYFRTVDLESDQRDKANTVGITTILMAFAARLGYEVQDVVPIGFNASKADWDALSGPSTWRSVRLTLKKAGRQVTLDYISLDLSDRGLQARPELEGWMNALAAKPVLLKAASHLLQEPQFQSLRSKIVQAAPLVVQDETGLDFNDLKPIGPVRLYGKFVKTHGLFKATKQKSLAAAYKADTAPGELPFAFSYLKSDGARSMQIARRPSTVKAKS